jgi:hypothetical protein
MKPNDQYADSLLAELDDAWAVALWVAGWVEQFEKLAPPALQKVEVSNESRTSKSVPG